MNTKAKQVKRKKPLKTLKDILQYSSKADLLDIYDYKN